MGDHLAHFLSIEEVILGVLGHLVILGSRHHPHGIGDLGSLFSGLNPLFNFI